MFGILHLESYPFMKSNDSVIACDEIIGTVAKSYDDTPKTVSINSNNKKAKYKMDYYIFHTLLLVNTCLLLRYYMKHQMKTKKIYYHINYMNLISLMKLI